MGVEKLADKMLFTFIPQGYKGSFTVTVGSNFCAEVPLEVSPKQTQIF